MEATYPLLLVVLGFGVAAYGTLIGAGGAVALLPVLILLYPAATPTTLTAISFIIVFINALSGTLAYARQRRVDYRTGGAFAIATIPGTVAGVMITNYLSRDLFSLIFGIVLILFSLLLVFRPKREDRARSTGTVRSLTDTSGRVFNYSFDMSLGVAISFGVGFMAGILGVGGGIIHVPAMIYLLGFPAHIATATSHFILVFTSLTGSLTHAVSGEYAQVWQLVLWLAIG